MKIYTTLHSSSEKQLSTETRDAQSTIFEEKRHTNVPETFDRRKKTNSSLQRNMVLITATKTLVRS